MEQGQLDSYLIEITAKVLAADDPKTGRPMVDMISTAPARRAPANGGHQRAAARHSRDRDRGAVAARVLSR